MKKDKIINGLRKLSGNIVQEIEAKYLERKRMKKCLSDYCEGKLQDDYWNTDGIEYEQYLCEDCSALHEIPITRNDKGYNECVDIDRHWEELEMIDENYSEVL